MDLKSYIRNVPDFPEPGIQFKDITPLLKDKEALNETFRQLAKKLENLDFDLIVGTESRGFIFGIGVSCIMNKGFVPIRKAGKLPCPTHKLSYALEYGEDSLEIHQDALTKGQKVILIDDLLATGGTMRTSIDLVKKCEAIPVGCAFVIELDFLNGRDTLDIPIHSLMSY
tara:strand:+ start:119 stop:628 length:510 start_codon:yes stop_codon:yes gene_type:complete